ncbi:MAG: right-handed parallel beta-helix repeat-containing protein [Burkholderiales bacterium]|nr:right-handed parallel beta-helix repeat-containing protein [Anaerolineae bacterium]
MTIRKHTFLLIAAFVLLVYPANAQRTPTDISYDSLALTEVWIDPINGDDDASGASRDAALRTLSAAWNRIPVGAELETGYRIRLVAGTYDDDDVPRYFESRYGTADYPIIIEAADGAATALLPSLNIFDTRFLYLIGLHISAGGGDVFHCERCDNLLLRDVTVVGADPATYNVQETVKINQSQHVFIENSDISGAWDNAIDFVAVQYGHVIDSRIHNAGDWCAYAKGGSGYLYYERNEIYDCGTGGFTAGQGTGFEYMAQPFLTYEAQNILFADNIIHDTDGAGIGVNGGSNIAFAYNTLYRVGARSHAIEVVFGARSCDGDTQRCADNLAQGGWGTAQIGDDYAQPIPNDGIYIYNNIIYNPIGFQSQWQHFDIHGPRIPAPDSNIPSPAQTDTSLQIRGNIIWNGPADLPLGIEADAGCQPDNPTCSADQLRAENAINTIEPQLIDPENGDYRPVPDGSVFSVTPVPMTLEIPDTDSCCDLPYDPQNVVNQPPGAFSR